jgi:hypothetical protein
MIEPKSITILCVGNWNKKIFTPNWVSSNIFHLPPDAPYEGTVNPNEYEFGYKHNNLTLIPKDTAVEIKLEKFDKETNDLASKVLIEIIELLPHTPLKGVGVNISYEVADNSNIHIVENINKIKCSLNGFLTAQLRFLKEYQDSVLNLIVENGSENKLNIIFNYHFSNSDTIQQEIVNDKLQDSQKVLKDE